MVSAAQSRLIQAELAPAAIGAQISAAVAAKSHDAEKQEGASVLQLLEGASEGATNNGLGGTLDITA